jgi:exopolysaccharide production protein ExoQ
MAVSEGSFGRMAPLAGGAGGGGQRTPSVLDGILERAPARETGEWLGIAFRFLVDCAVVLLLMITTNAVVGMATKLANGAPIPWAGFIWLSVIAIALGVAGLRPLRTLQTGLLMAPFVLLSGWVALSWFWSGSPYDTARGVTFLLGSHLACVALAARYSWEKLLRLLATALTIVVGLSVLLAIGAPGIGRMAEIHPGAWSGMFMEKQGLGFYAVHLMMLGVALSLYGGRSRWWLLVVPLAAMAIIGATGRSAMLMAGLGLAVMVWGWLIQQGPRLAIASSWLGLVGGLLAAGLVYLGADELLRFLGRSSDITGRAELWEALQLLVGLDPWRGLGYQSFWRGEEVMTSPYQWIMDYTGFKPANAHQSWLDAQVQIGLIGLGLLVACVGLTVGLSVAKLRGGGPGEVFAFGTLASLLLISFTETIFLNPMDFQWMMVVMFAAKFLIGDETVRPRLPQQGRLDGSTFTFARPAG